MSNAKETAFNFGANWQSFSQRKLDAWRVEQAMESIRGLLNRPSLQGASFLDVGCGSGLFSIAAYKLGAGRIVGIDIDPLCVTVAEGNRDKLAPGANLVFTEASVLDDSAMRRLGMFDLVYAWGSLHHSGSMWTAIRTVSERILPGGLLILSIYNRHFTSPVWTAIKWSYNRLPGFGRFVMTIPLAGIIYVSKYLVTRQNPLRKERGMDFWHDVVDWIGGYPYEYARRHEVESFLNRLGFDARRVVPARVPTGCNEFVFVRRAAAGLRDAAV